MTSPIFTRETYLVDPEYRDGKISKLAQEMGFELPGTTLPPEAQFYYLISKPNVLGPHIAS